MENKKLSLEELIAREREFRCEAGMFGVKACKEAIEFDLKYCNTSLFELLGDYYQRYLHEFGFNSTMILACWEMINER